MLKNDVLETIKEVLELSSKADAERELEKITKVVTAVSEKLVEDEKANIGVLKLEKKLKKGRTGESFGKAYKTEDKLVTKIDSI